jgi:hypothetical protein
VKILQNKVFVILLAVFAFALVGRNVFLPIIKRKYPARTAASAPAARPVAAAVPTQNNKPAAAAVSTRESKEETHEVPVQPMNVAEASSFASQWAQNPKRDPFKVAGSRSDGKAARDLLTLGGVLRQTDSILAVLNNQVLAAGDTILGFRIETVEDQCVWVTGPNGREQVEFKYSLPPAPEVRPKDKDLSLAEQARESSR